MKIKLKVLTLAAAVSAVVLTGCQYPNGEPNNTASGALIGGAMGAIAGAAIGGPRNGGAGALIGAAAGAITGGVIGNSMDQEQAAELRAQAPQTYVRVQQGQPLSIADVKALAAARVSDDVIINQIRNSHTAFHLSSADIIDLHNSGVSENVINFMINSPSWSGMIQPSNQHGCRRKRHPRRRRKPWWLRPARAMFGLAVNGSGTADGSGGRVIGLIRPILMRFGWVAIGAGGHLVGTGDEDIGGNLTLLPGMREYALSPFLLFALRLS